MTARRLGLVLFTVGTVGILLAAVAIWRSADEDAGTTTTLAGDAISVQTSIAPPTHLFGDAVVATAEVVVKRDIVDPGSVRIARNFGRYQLAGEPMVTRRDGADLTELVFRFPLRCLRLGCAYAPAKRSVVLPEATISYNLRNGQHGQARRPWVPLEAVSRLRPADIADPRWRLDLRRPPTVTYRVNPGFLAAGLLAASCAFVLAAGVLAGLAVSRRRQRPAAEPAPVRAASPLTRALEALAAAGANSSPSERRQALELVAGEVEAAGHPDLADEAWRLAWSRTPPSREAVADLSRSLRLSLGREG
ncbi:MAG: hypothetical protein M3322_12265 [Actinomycetota bacterium]|nr:hypothetical protein [Actinomycetota bacterium]